MITCFRDEYSFLSNFHLAPIIYGRQQRMWPTAEHLFQAWKCVNPDDARRILTAPTPGAAKRLGRQISMRKNWMSIRLTVMETIVRLKFQQNASLTRLLLNTGDQQIIEGNSRGDRFWGAEWNGATWVGENHLGKILMKVREELHSTK